MFRKMKGKRLCLGYQLQDFLSVAMQSAGLSQCEHLFRKQFRQQVIQMQA